MLLESQKALRQRILDGVKQPFNMRKINRFINTIQLNLTRNSGYYALVSSLMCLCIIGLRSGESPHQETDDIDAELHYTFHNWEPKVFFYIPLLCAVITIYNLISFYIECHSSEDAREGESATSLFLL